MKLRSLKNLLVSGKIDLDGSIIRGVGHTILQESIIFNKYEIFRLCLAMDGKIIKIIFFQKSSLFKANVNKKDESGTFPIFNAIYLGRTLMIKELLQRKELDLNVRDGVNRNVLEAAEFYDNFEVYQIIKEAVKERQIILENYKKT